MGRRGYPEFRSPTVLYYIHDPMCSWCYAFAPVWASVCDMLNGAVEIRTVLGGLAPDSDLPMNTDMSCRIRSTWEQITNVVPGTEFNHDFWTVCKPRRSTYPACRAIIAAREQGIEHESAMIVAIQNAYYQEAKNPSLPETLISLAGEIGLDIKRFEAVLGGQECENKLQEEITRAINLGVRGFPALILLKDDVAIHLKHDYNNADITYDRIKEGLDLQLLASKVK